MLNDPPPISHRVGEAVLIAALSALVTGFVNWGIEELKKYCDEEENDNKGKDQ